MNCMHLWRTCLERGGAGRPVLEPEVLVGLDVERHLVQRVQIALMCSLVHTRRACIAINRRSTRCSSD